MPQPLTLAPGIFTSSSTLPWTMRREARLRPEHGHRYPGVYPGVWESAAVVVDRIVAARLLSGEWLAVPGRVLSDEHFEFRGGTAAEVRPRREDR